MGGGVIYNRDTTRPVYIGTHGDIVGGNINKLSIIDPLTALYLPGDDDVWAMAPTGTDYNNPVPVDYVYAGRSQMHTSHSVLTAPLTDAASGLTDMNTALGTVNDQLSIIAGLLQNLPSGGTTVVSTDGAILPSEVGVVAWTADPTLVTNTAMTVVSNNTTRFYSFNGGVISNIQWQLSTAATTVTDLLIGVYSDDGTQLITQTGNRGQNGTSDVASTGIKISPFLTPGTLIPDSWYRTLIQFAGATSMSVAGLSALGPAFWGSFTPSAMRSGIISGLTMDTTNYLMPSSVNPTTVITSIPGAGPILAMLT
jgi:hypothetical protein